MIELPSREFEHWNMSSETFTVDFPLVKQYENRWGEVLYENL
jgi:hypothetical protein